MWLSRGEGILNNIGEIHRQLEQYEEALIYYENALVMSKDLNNFGNMAGILINMGHIYRCLNQNIKTLNIYKDSLTYCRKIDDKIKIGEVLNCLGEAYEKLQKEHVALQYYRNVAKSPRFQSWDEGGSRFVSK
ncbi:tetratricopeptide repeat protein [Desulfosporosinus acididurans]|uniref:tetratricopeptide repeat protein n=1 Tax=Desulfosporosinus acididurans TaxID=476652 RepID=UPI00137937E8|nr:tetratricopeptide repeat protein [Desulfosporosinus acididurans]